MTKANYQVYLKSYRWRVVRALRMWLDGKRCLFCYAADGEIDRNGHHRHLEVHHRDYRWCGRGGIVGLLKEIADVAVFCDVCHRVGHEHNELSDFLDMQRQTHKMPLLLLVFVLFVLLGIQNALYGWLSVVLSILAAAYMALIAMFFYRV